MTTQTILIVGQSGVALLVAFIGYFARRKVNQIHVLVNSRLDESLNRVKALENKLGLAQGEAIPGPQVVSVLSPSVDKTADDAEGAPK